MVSSFLTRPNQEGIREQQTDVGINTPLSLWGAYFKWIHILICYLPVKPPALCFFFFPSNTAFCLYLLLLPQNSNNPYTATPRRRFVLFPNTATPRKCSDALMQPSVFFPKLRRRSLSLSDYWTTICYLPPGTAPKMKIIDSDNGGFFQPSLFLMAFERVTDSQVYFKSSRVFFKFS